MKTARALTVLIVASIIGAGLGLTAHAVTRSGDPSTQDAGEQSTSTPTTSRPPTTPATTRSPESSPTASATSSSRLAPLSLRNVLTADDLQQANFEVARGRYTQGDANEVQYALTPCMRQSLGQLTGNNAFAADAYGDGNAFVAEAVSDMTTEAQASTAARTLVRWHTGTCPGGSTFSADETRQVEGGTVWTFLSDHGDAVEIVQVRDRLAVVTTVSEPSAATTQNVFDAAIQRLVTPAR